MAPMRCVSIAVRTSPRPPHQPALCEAIEFFLSGSEAEEALRQVLNDLDLVALHLARAEPEVDADLS
jgi:hypothetical protein